MKAKKASRRQALLGAGAAVMAHAQGALSAGGPAAMCAAQTGRTHDLHPTAS